MILFSCMSIITLIDTRLDRAPGELRRDQGQGRAVGHVGAGHEPPAQGDRPTQDVAQWLHPHDDDEDRPTGAETFELASYEMIKSIG